MRDKAPTRQLHTVPIAASGSSHTGKRVYYFGAVAHMQESTNKVPKSVSKEVFLQEAAPPTFPPNTSRRFALGASNVCLVGEKPRYSVPEVQGCEGLWSYDYGHAWHEYLPHRCYCCYRCCYCFLFFFMSLSFFLVSMCLLVLLFLCHRLLVCLVLLSCFDICLLVCLLGCLFAVLSKGSTWFLW